MVEGRCQTRQAGTSFSGQCLGWVETIESTVVLARPQVGESLARANLSVCLCRLRAKCPGNQNAGLVMARGGREVNQE